jgi:hypothetical protein
MIFPDFRIASNTCSGIMVCKDDLLREGWYKYTCEAWRTTTKAC